jgi:TP901 family phage tail tape measure protein
VSDRTVKVTLIANATGYIQGVDQAARKTRELGTEAEKLAAKREAFSRLGTTFLAVGLAAALGVGFAISKFAEFDQSMSQVNAVTQETTANQKLLRDAALEAGGATVFTAKEAAQAEEELAKAGLATASIIGGALTGALDLAASGQLEVARSAEITAITLKQFNLAGGDAARVADVLSAGANKALGSVEDLAQGLKFVGPVAASMNVSLEDTVATLALFADQGVLGEQAGTSLRGVLSSLTSPAKQANEEIKRLGITLYDSEGRFLGLKNAAGELNKAYIGVTDAEKDLSLGIIFGNQQVTAARVLVGAGAAKWQEYRDAVDDAGIAQRIAAERMNNLTGDIEKLGGAFDTALIQTGSGANDVLRDIVQSVTFLVDTVGELPEPVLGSALAIGGLVAVMGIAVGLAGKGIVAFGSLKTSLDAVGISGKVAGLGMAGFAAAIGLATLVVGSLIQRQAEYDADVDTLTASLDQATGALTKNTRAIQVNSLEQRGSLEDAKRLGISLDLVTEAALGDAEALAEVTKQANAAAQAAAGTGDAWDFSIRAENLKEDLGIVNDQLADSEESWKRQSDALEGAEDAENANSDALELMSKRAQETQDAIDGLADSIRGFGSAALSTREAEREFQAAIDDVTASILENGTTLDLNTAEGRENEAALDALARASLDRAAAIVEETGSQEDATAAVQAGRDALIASLAQYGIVGQAAEDYADRLGLIPGDIPTVVTLDMSQANNELSRFFRQWNGKTVAVNVNAKEGHNYAFGGYTGDGGKFDYAGAVHKREWVSTAETVAKPANREALEYMHAGGDMDRWRGAPTLQAAPARTAAAAQFNVVVSSKGGVNLLEYVDVRIEQADQSDQLTTRIGRG